MERGVHPTAWHGKESRRTATDRSMWLPAAATIQAQPQAAVCGEKVEASRLGPGEKASCPGNGTPMLSAVAGDEQSHRRSREENAGIGWVRNDVDQRPGESLLSPCSAPIPTDEEAPVRYVIADDALAICAQHMEVSFTEE
jgi:hypothetical protein